ncbi:MAG TPA: lactonase family protein [Verrucomicrobiae bacterium]
MQRLSLMSCLLLTFWSILQAAPARYLVYFGTYTGPKSQGIYVARFDATTGKLGMPELAAETKSPSFLAVHPNERFLYAVGEGTMLEGTRSGAVSAFALNKRSGQLSLLNQQPSGGLGPCHLALESKGRCLLAANYGSGSVTSLPVRKDGSLGEPVSTIQHIGASVNPQRQAGPHAHFITADPRDRFALCCDLGLDQVLVYRLDPKRATLIANDPPFATVKPGAGPRHLAFSPNGRFVFVINELASTVAVFAYDARRGTLAERQTVSTLPAGHPGTNTTCAEIAVHPSGKFVFGSNRGHESIVTFAVDTKTGVLSHVAHQPTGGRTPRHFVIDPTGQWLLAENQASDTVTVFRIDPRSGRLAPTGQTAAVPSPVCAVFVAAE